MLIQLQLSGIRGPSILDYISFPGKTDLVIDRATLFNSYCKIKVLVHHWRLRSGWWVAADGSSACGGPTPSFPYHRQVWGVPEGEARKNQVCRGGGKYKLLWVVPCVNDRHRVGCNVGKQEVPRCMKWTNLKQVLFLPLKQVQAYFAN